MMGVVRCSDSNLNQLAALPIHVGEAGSHQNWFLCPFGRSSLGVYRLAVPTSFLAVNLSKAAWTKWTGTENIIVL